MATISVEVEIGDFDLDDILKYLLKISNGAYFPKNDIIDFIKKLQLKLPDEEKTITSKVEEWKNELWPAIREKCSLEQLESLLK
ncbi:MAG: hypothetical protein P4L31_07610 [Candidatus Babeliales bacterium]|nr:hypothetical protein [Candidatus Babeliales bacterium]